MPDTETLVAILSRGSPEIEATISYKESITAELTLPLSQDKEIYQGEYEIDPDTEDDQVLSTRQKLLIDDITVHKIQYTETINPAGGTTVYIG